MYTIESQPSCGCLEIKNKIKLFVSELKETKMKNRVEDWGQDKDADEKLKAEHLYYI